MTEIACPGTCNNRARKLWAAYETAWEAWETTEKRHADWRRTVTERGERAAGAEPGRPSRPEPPEAKPRYGEPIWCRTCGAKLRACLSDLDELMSLRLTMADGYQQPGQTTAERVTASKTAPSPSPAQDDLDDVVRWLTGWETALRESQGWTTTPYRGVNAPNLTSAISWMLQRLDVLLAHPDLAADFGRELLREHSRLQQLTSTRPAMRHKPLPCPRCRRRSLFLHDDETVRCQPSKDADCGKIMSKKEYDELEEEADRQVAS